MSRGEGRDQALGLLPALAAAQYAAGEDGDAEDPRGTEAELDAQQPFARPVDVAQVEEQRGLVEGEPHADAHRYREPLLEQVVIAEQSRRPRAEGEQDSGNEVVDVAAAHSDVVERAPVVTDPQRRQ